MDPRDPTVVSLFYRCRALPEFKLLHARLVTRGRPIPARALRPVISFAALHPYGDLHYSLLLLERSPLPPTSNPHFLFNSALRALARRPCALGLASLLRRMSAVNLRPNHFTFTFLFQACASSCDLRLGRQLHAAAVKVSSASDPFVSNSVIQFYSVSGELDDAMRVFEDGRAPDVVSWNSLINGLLTRGLVPDAFLMFDKMPERNAVSWNSMVSGLVRNGRLDAARFLFDEMPERNAVSWAAMISGYSQSGKPKEALGLFRQMQSLHQEMNSAVLVSALSAASQLGALEHGKWIHAYVRRKRVKMETALSTALVSMYANCGNIDLAMQVFHDPAASKDVRTYTSIVLGLAVNGRGAEALSLFEQMKVDGIALDGVAYIAVLCACSHMGWVDQGFNYFNDMVSLHKIEAQLDHYACMVDLLGRAGFLEQAERFVISMPVEPDSVIWGALLNACRIHGNAEMGKRVGEFLMELDQCHDGRYITLSNIYAEFDIVENAVEVRKTMRRRKVDRVPGFSSIELDGIVHEFVAGDKSHERSDDIYLKWEEIVREIRKVGYAAETRGVVFDVEEEEKETIVGFHSEKLAIAFGLINTELGTPLRIVKNIRICRDCHSAAKHISSVFNKIIVIRDRKRFHHFEKGSCSCMDYW